MAYFPNVPQQVSDAVDRAIAAEAQVTGMSGAELLHDEYIGNIGYLAVSELVPTPDVKKTTIAKHYVGAELGKRQKS